MDQRVNIFKAKRLFQSLFHIYEANPWFYFTLKLNYTYISKLSMYIVYYTLPYKDPYQYLDQGCGVVSGLTVPQH